jgi:wobble nucleotide-excising tRNase
MNNKIEENAINAITEINEVIKELLKQSEAIIDNDTAPGSKEDVADMERYQEIHRRIKNLIKAKANLYATIACLND